MDGLSWPGAELKEKTLLSLVLGPADEERREKGREVY